MKNLLYAQSGDPTAAQQALSLQRQKNNFKKILYAHFGMDDRN